MVTINDLVPVQRFVQYLASTNSNFQLNAFLDKTGVQGELQSDKTNMIRCLNPPAFKMFKLFYLGYFSVRDWYVYHTAPFFNDKIQSALAQAVYLDPHMKQAHDQAKAVGNGVWPCWAWLWPGAF